MLYCHLFWSGTPCERNVGAAALAMLGAPKHRRWASRVLLRCAPAARMPGVISGSAGAIRLGGERTGQPWQPRPLQLRARHPCEAGAVQIGIDAWARKARDGSITFGNDQGGGRVFLQLAHFAE